MERYLAAPLGGSWKFSPNAKVTDRVLVIEVPASFEWFYVSRMKKCLLQEQYLFPSQKIEAKKTLKKL
jgi:hypothetical protein